MIFPLTFVADPALGWTLLLYFMLEIAVLAFALVSPSPPAAVLSLSSQLHDLQVLLQPVNLLIRGLLSCMSAPDSPDPLCPCCQPSHGQRIGFAGLPRLHGLDGGLEHEVLRQRLLCEVPVFHSSYQSHPCKVCLFYRLAVCPAQPSLVLCCRHEVHGRHISLAHPEQIYHGPVSVYEGQELLLRQGDQLLIGVGRLGCPTLCNVLYDGCEASPDLLFPE